MPRTFRVVAIATAAIVAAGVAMAGALQFPAAQRALLRAALQAAGGEAIAAVEVDRVSGLPFGPLVVAGLSLADGEGPWLAMDRLEIDWRPSRLLAGRLDIAALTLGTLDIARLPAPDAASPPTRDDTLIPRLPFDLRLGRLSVGRIALGEAVAGVAMAVALDGDVHAGSDGSAFARLAMTPLDGPAGRLAVDAALGPGGEAFTLSVDYREPAGGLVAHLAGRPDLPALALALSGDGPLSEWYGRLDASAEGLVDAEGSLTLARRDEGLAAALALRPSFGAAAPPLLAALLGPHPALDLDFVFAGDTIRVDRLAVAGATFAATGSGSFTPAGEAVRASVTATARGDALWRALDLPAAASAATLAVDLGGRLVRPEISARFEAETMTVDEFRIGRATLSARLDPQGELTGSDPRIAIAVDGQLAEVGSDIPEIAPLLAGPLDISLRALANLADDTLAIAPSRLAGPALAVDLAGEADAAAGTVRLRLVATASRLLALDLPLSLGPGGQAELTADLAVGADGAMGGPVALAFRDLRSEEPALAAILGPTPTLAGRLTQLGGDGMRLEEIRVAGRALSAGGSAVIAGRWKGVDATLDARLDGLDRALGLPATVGVAGPVRARLRLDGALARPALTAHLSTSAIRAGPSTFEAVTATVTTGPLATATSAKLALRASDDGTPLTLDAAVARDRDGTISVDGLKLASGATVASGRLRFHPAAGLADGTFEARMPDVARWAALGGISADGDIAMNVTLTSAGGKQGARVVARANRLALQDGPEAATLALDATLADLLGRPTGRLTLGANSVAFGATTAQNPSLALSGGPEVWSVEARSAVAGPAPGDLALAGTLRPVDRGAAFVLSRLDGTLAGTRIAQRGQAEFAVDGQRLAVRDLALVVGDGRIDLSVERAPERLALALKVAALPLAPVAMLLGLPGLSGRLDGEAAIAGTAAAPAGTLSFALGDVIDRSAGAAPLPPLTATLSGRWADGMVSVEATASSPGTAPVALSAQLPLRLDPESLAPVMPPDGALAAAIDWQGRVEPLWELAPLDDHLLAGEASLTLRVSGTVARPHATGRFRLPQGRYENLLSGTLLEPLDLDVRVDDGRTVVAKLTARDGGTGTVTAEGTVVLDPAAGLPLAMQVRLAHAVIVRRDEAVATASGDIAIGGSVAAARISGTVDIEHAEVTLVDRLPPSVVELPVRDAAVPLRPPTPRTGEGATLDLAVRAPGRMFVRGRGLDSEWAGDLRIAGPAAAPTIAGEVTSVRGVFDFAGRDFTLNTGRIVFDGGAAIDPRLDVAAEHNTGDITAVVSVRGRASAPDIAITSRPPLPQDDIIAQVLFRKRSGTLSPVEALQVAQTAASLSGQGSATGGVLDRFRTALGVDVLRIDGGGTSTDGTAAGPSLAAGKYLSDRTYLGVRQGATPGSGAMSVEVELTDNLTLESEVGETGSGRTGILWNWDY